MQKMKKSQKLIKKEEENQKQTHVQDHLKLKQENAPVHCKHGIFSEFLVVVSCFFWYAEILLFVGNS